MKKLCLFITAVACCAPVTLAQDKPSAEPAKPGAAPAAAPAEAPKADEPKVLHRAEKDGLIMEDLVIGTGAEVKPGGVIVAHYRGKLKDTGVEFDSSYNRGEPLTIPLKNLVKGWQEGIPGMKIGGKRRLTIPWAMAYGEQGRPPIIPGKADLIFEIEMIDTLVCDDVKEGAGAACTPSAGMMPTIRYTIRKVGSNEIVSQSDEKGEQIDIRAMIPAIQMSLEGMKVKGTRKIVFPASMAWQQKPSPFPAGTRLECEFELVALPEIPAATPIPGGGR